MIHRSWTSTAPVSEPVTLAEAKNHLRVEHTADDSLISALISAARQWVENHLGRVCHSRTITEKWDCFPPKIFELRWVPVATFTSLEYRDSTGQQTFPADNYVADKNSEPARVILKWGKTFPETDNNPAAVTLTYTAGYDVGQVPQPIAQAILLLVGSMYANREDSVKQLPTAAEYLLQPYRVESL